MTTESVTGQDLKQLQPLKDVGSYASNKTYDVASSMYTSTKGAMPQALQQVLSTVEEKATQMGSPVVTTLQDRSDKVLHSVDGAVDSLVKNHQNLITESFDHGKTTFVHYVDQTVDGFKEKGVTGLAQSAAEEARKKLSTVAPTVSAKTEQGLDFVSGIYEKVVSHSAVQQVWGFSKPKVDTYVAPTYFKVHDTLVSLPVYHRFYDGLNSVRDWAIYKNTVNTVYPYVAPVADPVLNKVTATDAYKAALEQLQPKSTQTVNATA